MRFSKMQALGNDFVVIDGVRQDVRLTSEQVRRICDRHLGAGCDQLLIVAPPEGPGYDFTYVIYNGDGSKAEQCGNGARCVAEFIAKKNLSGKKRIRLRTKAREIVTERHGGGIVSVDMGEPVFGAKASGFQERHPDLSQGAPGVWRAKALGGADIVPVSMGNPCAVLLMREAPSQTEFERIGREISAGPYFTEGANAVFTRVLDRRNIAVRVFERGAGETLSCGTGSSAAAAAAIRLGLTENKVTVHAALGELAVAWRKGSGVVLTGPAAFVYDGMISI